MQTDRTAAVADDLEASIRKMIVEVIPGRYKSIEIGPDTRLKQDLGIDSIGLIAMLFRFEQTFGVDLSSADVAGGLDQLVTFGDAVRLGRELVEEAQ